MSCDAKIGQPSTIVAPMVKGLRYGPPILIWVRPWPGFESRSAHAFLFFFRYRSYGPAKPTLVHHPNSPLGLLFHFFLIGRVLLLVIRLHVQIGDLLGSSEWTSAKSAWSLQLRVNQEERIR